MNNLQDILEERGKRYGNFYEHASLTRALKRAIAGWIKIKGAPLDSDQQEALDMICHKIARIVCGDPNYADSWVDIAGYAQLVANRLNGNG